MVLLPPGFHCYYPIIEFLTGAFFFINEPASVDNKVEPPGICLFDPLDSFLKELERIELLDICFLVFRSLMLSFSMVAFIRLTGPDAPGATFLIRPEAALNL